MDLEPVGRVVDHLDGSLGFSKNLGPRLSRKMADEAAQNAMRSTRDELLKFCRAHGFDPWGDDAEWEP